MGDLVLAHRDQAGLVHEDVGALEEGIAQKAIGGQVALLQPLLLILETGYSLQPTQGGDHGEEQVEFRVLGHLGLDEEGRLVRVDARG